ncbi:MAG: hypothetical protein PHO70_08355 [Candidatus Omnitrophica bacterium]|nr:hypothetical protein [Candidatus Omnitrophota bacterium]
MRIEAFNSDKACSEFIDNLKLLFKKIIPEGISDAQKDEFVDIREAVLGYHFLVEAQFNILLALRSLKASKKTSDNDKELEKSLDYYVRMSFKPKIKLMKRFFAKTQIDFSVFSQLDDLRNVFAHNLPFKDGRYKKVKSIKDRLDFFQKITNVVSKLIELRFNSIVVDQAKVSKSS